MGNRCTEIRQAIIVDLDGTLISTNSFKQYIAFAYQEAMKACRFDIAINLMINVASRKLRIISHSEMKRRILLSTNEFMCQKKRIERLADKLIAKSNPHVVAQIEQCKAEGLFTCLATAAPISYAQPISSRFGIDDCCATSIDINADWTENVGDIKLKSVEDCCNRHNTSPAIVITDHHDDLPLLLFNKGKNILIAPSHKTIEILTQHNIKFTIEK